MDQLLLDFAKQGAGYLIAAFLAYFLLKQLARNEAVNDKRIEDQKEFNKEFVAVIGRSADVMNRMTTAVDSLKALIETISRK